MPDTARVIPAKYVYVSPTKTLAGYWLYLSSANELNIKGSNSDMLNVC